VLVVVWSSRLVIGAPYFEAPGLALATFANRHFRWDVGDLHLAYIGVAVVSVALILARGRRGIPAVTAILVCAWMLSGQVYATVTNTDLADRFSKTIGEPRDWVDQATGGGAVTYLGQKITDPNQLWLTEFWNRSLHHVGSLDASAPGPGPTVTPGLASTDGTLSGSTDDPYVLADNGVNLQAPVVAERDGMTLYRVAEPWKLRDATSGIYADGWAGGVSKYALLRKGGPGVMVVDLSRTAYQGNAPPGRARVAVGTVRLDENGAPQVDHVIASSEAIVRNGKEVTVRLHVPSTPAAVVVRIAPGFHEGSDPRELAALVAFRFEPDR
jgi:hypothetical protein